MSDLVSIIIPVFNAEQYVRDCLESVLNQTYRNIQVIAVDDGSTDDSLRICKNVAAGTDRIVVISQQNQGVSSARNAGLHSAGGEYVMFVDSDDAVDPELCSSLLDAAQQNDSDLVISGISYFRDGEKRVSSSLPEDSADFSLDLFQSAFDELFQKGLINPPFNKIYKKSLITRLFDEQTSLGEDLLFNLDYFRNCRKITTLPKSFYRYRIGRDHTLSSTYREDGFDIALNQYHAVRRFKRSLWGEGCPAEPEAHKLIDDLCTNAEHLVRKSSYDRGQIHAVLKRYFNQDTVREIFAASGYRESLKYRIYKRLLRNQSFHLFYCFSTMLAILKHERG